MPFPHRRKSIAFIAAIASFAIAQSGGAQGSPLVASISIEATWNGGYMGLGGGLIKAIDDGAKKVTHGATNDAEPEKAHSTPQPAPKRVRHRRPAATVATRPTRRVIDRAPVTLISETLDHTGLNISTLTARQSAQ